MQRDILQSEGFVMQFTDEQNRAIDAIVAWYGDPEKMEFYIAGYAGVGKSTCIAEAISRIKSKYDITDVKTAAYTGKAAFVLRKKGNENAQTIHSMIYKCVQKRDEKGNETGEFEFIRNSELKTDLIVLDEVSMVSKEIVDDFRAFKIKTVVLGDPGQLPPVSGEGAFTNREPDVFLQEVHRQSLDSPILELATMARNGIHLPVGYSKNGVRVLQLTTETEELLHAPETQVICGLNRTRWAVSQIMRQRLGFTEKMPMAGERIICCKNNHQKGLFNGAMGEVISVERLDSSVYIMNADIEGISRKKLRVDSYLFNQHFEANPVKADWKKKLDTADWAYAITCHKAQGSGFPHCTVIDDSDAFRESKWKWLYTAATRAENGLIILVK